MVYVPMPAPQPPPSPRVRELGAQLAHVIKEFERRYPDLSPTDVQRAAQLAMRKEGKSPEANRQAIVMGVGIAAFLVGLLAYMAQEGRFENLGGGPILWIIGGIAVVGGLAVGSALMRKRE